jgi:hypothetical protein
MSYTPVHRSHDYIHRIHIVVRFMDVVGRYLNVQVADSCPDDVGRFYLAI